MNFFFIGFKDLIELTEKYIVNEVLSIQKVDIYQNIRSLLPFGGQELADGVSEGSEEPNGSF